MYCLKIHKQELLFKEQAEQEKCRIQLYGQGKSSGARIIYLDVFEKEKLYLLFAYPKNVQSDLTSDQKKAIKNIIELIKKE